MIDTMAGRGVETMYAATVMVDSWGTLTLVPARFRSSEFDAGLAQEIAAVDEDLSRYRSALVRIQRGNEHAHPLVRAVGRDLPGHIAHSEGSLHVPVKQPQYQLMPPSRRNMRRRVSAAVGLDEEARGDGGEQLERLEGAVVRGVVRRIPAVRLHHAAHRLRPVSLVQGRNLFRPVLDRRGDERRVVAYLGHPGRHLLLARSHSLRHCLSHPRQSCQQPRPLRAGLFRDPRLRLLRFLRVALWSRRHTVLRVGAFVQRRRALTRRASSHEGAEEERRTHSPGPRFGLRVAGLWCGDVPVLGRHLVPEHIVGGVVRELGGRLPQREERRAHGRLRARVRPHEAARGAGVVRAARAP
mmetsp:Transcript_12150/g.26079  ORF Transcript_12150/g.26079 Transcript_12150/m.26079 type:complete len:355 (-) Transcript_12150:46-1110(-)